MERKRNDWPIEVFIADREKYQDGILDGRWLKLPADQEVLQEFERSGVMDRQLIADVYSPVYGLSDLIDPDDDLLKIDRLARKIRTMSGKKLKRFKAIVEFGSYLTGLDDLLAVSDDPEAYVLLPQVRTYADLGRYYRRQIRFKHIRTLAGILDYFDYDSYGKQIDQDEEGGFTSFGYIFRKDRLKDMHRETVDAW